MRFTSSLRMQSLTLLVGSLLLMLVVAITSVLTLGAELRNYRNLMEGPVAMAGLISEANLAFKEQVQEWKNVLLRGAEPADLDRYWRQFQTSETQVQSLLGQVSELDVSSEVHRQITTLRSTHQQLGQRYREGLANFVATNHDPVAGDTLLRGIDRDTVGRLQELSEQMQQAADSEVERIRESAMRTAVLGLIILLVSALGISICASVLLNRRLVTPITALVGHMEQLGQGRFDTPITSNRSDELGTLARSAEQLRGFLGDTAAGLRNTTNELDQASGGLSNQCRICSSRCRTRPT